MEKWQQEYIDNVRRIQTLSDFYASSEHDFSLWYSERLAAEEELRSLSAQNVSLLNRNLFPALDDLHSASESDAESLSEFADILMDWSTNLDCGVYNAVHEALLSVCRVRRDREGVIRELYKLGMGRYYQRRLLSGIDHHERSAFSFQNEMLFTEAGSYIRYYDEIDDEQTRGFIIRSMANVALCAAESSRRIAASARTLLVTQDPHYRELAPGLPWDSFVRRTHQQMSANRSELTRGDLTRDELAAVLDSCYEVFKPEESAADPSIRWLWPYYEMEYNCGYVSLSTTILRLENLITRTPADQYDMDGLYGNVQLAVYYGRLLKDHPSLREDPLRVRFLASAYRKMMQALINCPAEHQDDYFYYNVDLVITDYFETPGVPSYREITGLLIRRFAGESYIRFRRTGIAARVICDAVMSHEPDFFDDIPFIRDISDPDKKKARLLAYAEDCGLYFDFGLIKMNIGRIMQTRNLFENEHRIYRLHTVSGHDDLSKRHSTEIFADVALGHHSWYDGSGGYPDEYRRIDSPYRQMTDVISCAAVLASCDARDLDETLSEMQRSAGRQFSPMIMAYLADAGLCEQLRQLAESEDAIFYQEVWEQIQASEL